MNENFAKNLKKIRLHLGWSMQKMAKRTKKDKKTILSWETDPNVTPHPSNLKDVIDTLGDAMGRFLMLEDFDDPDLKISKLPLKGDHKSSPHSASSRYTSD